MHGKNVNQRIFYFLELMKAPLFLRERCGPQVQFGNERNQSLLTRLIWWPDFEAN